MHTSLSPFIESWQAPRRRGWAPGSRAAYEQRFAVFCEKVGLEWIALGKRRAVYRLHAYPRPAAGVLFSAHQHGWNRGTVAELADLLMLVEELKLRPGRHCRCPLHRPDIHARADKYAAAQRNVKDGGHADEH